MIHQRFLIFWKYVSCVYHKITCISGGNNIRRVASGQMQRSSLFFPSTNLDLFDVLIVCFIVVMTARPCVFSPSNSFFLVEMACQLFRKRVFVLRVFVQPNECCASVTRALTLVATETHHDRARPESARRFEMFGGSYRGVELQQARRSAVPLIILT